MVIDFVYFDIFYIKSHTLYVQYKSVIYNYCYILLDIQLMKVMYGQEFLFIFMFMINGEIIWICKIFLYWYKYIYFKFCKLQSLILPLSLCFYFKCFSILIHFPVLLILWSKKCQGIYFCWLKFERARNIY